MQQDVLFDRINFELDTSGMCHRSDPPTSREAAQAVEPHRSDLQADVLQAFEHYGPMTDEELESLARFADYGPSTIRKRRSELAHQGVLVEVNKQANSRGRQMVVWGLK